MRGPRLRVRTLRRWRWQTHLSAGRDVIVPQFLRRVGFIDELAEVADGTEASFVKTALWMDRVTAIAAFADR